MSSFKSLSQISNIWLDGATVKGCGMFPMQQKNTVGDWPWFPANPHWWKKPLYRLLWAGYGCTRRRAVKRRFSPRSDKGSPAGEAQILTLLLYGIHGHDKLNPASLSLPPAGLGRASLKSLVRHRVNVWMLIFPYFFYFFALFVLVHWPAGGILAPCLTFCTRRRW